ncbi:helix-turn-helix domain-containing protein [Blautia producta]|uniref:helix-turn-helix domain-containing protein n=1 Tax=Blautia producta TaxID=33035 RepID=UPI001FA881BB|nr:helix-turn-helix transcriptional regulator [Blautia coccoides]
MHFSPQQFLMRHRITKATEMLVETDHLIQNIASSCGYANELSFAKAFKKVTGLSPSEYRKKKRIPPNTIRREDPHKDESF